MERTLYKYLVRDMTKINLSWFRWFDIEPVNFRAGGVIYYTHYFLIIETPLTNIQIKEAGAELYERKKDETISYSTKSNADDQQP